MSKGNAINLFHGIIGVAFGGLALFIALLAMGWIFRIAESGWMADGRDLASMAAYAAMFIIFVFLARCALIKATKEGK